MEMLVILLIGLSGYIAGSNNTTTKTQPVSEAQQCATMCEKGVVAQYKWCKCQTKALWDGGN